jgi:replicative DNA helicase
MGHQWIISNKAEITHIRSIINTTVERENIKPWCIKLKKLQTARDLIKELNSAKKSLEKIDGSQSFNEILSHAEYPVQNFEYPVQNFSQSLNNTEDIVPIHTGVDSFLETVEGNPIDIVGISTSYPKLDNQIGGGLRNGAITLVGARTGFGKSLFSINVGLFISIKLKIPVLYLDTEMTLEDHQPRILSSLTYDNDFKVEISEIEKGKYINSPHKKRSVHEANNRFKHSLFDYASISGKPFEEHLMIMRKWIYKNVGFDTSGKANPCVIIYDYIKIGSAHQIQKVEERQALALMMMGTHDFAHKYSFPVLMFTQLNRDGLERADQSVIRGSDSALDPVTNFCILQPKSREEISVDSIEKGNAKMTIVKSRHGEVHEDGNYVSFHKIGRYAKFLEAK